MIPIIIIVKYLFILFTFVKTEFDRA
jgi:hypothetical protein